MSSRDRGGENGGGHHHSGSKNYQVYIGGLSRRVREDDLQYEFGRFGKIRNVSFKGRFAFVDFDESNSVRRAIDHMDGKRFMDDRISVEQARPRGGDEAIVDVDLVLQTSVSIVTKLVTGPLNAVREEEAQAAIATDAKAAASNAAEEVTSNVTAEVEDRADLEV
eukprot:CAMPEP_0176341680 /NCGR_PEP_ID=MMETSP0126-20121128/2574_1 /TAXON_ID=141414 ORGANISM="Strombidinopsis acuminatum, Strain SPMC142" /NCGR_SAMPLE_ID=MMETSP0126 /ASSEMBLY_ACC=CAM_ASM_000229 /LENGTH=164 /DNA_ID=CAMNT_0017686647 /DNA_START=615 /DNA_END=1110 /DNA_ORIENTATION=-